MKSPCTTNSVNYGTVADQICLEKKGISANIVFENPFSTYIRYEEVELTNIGYEKIVV